MTHVSTEAFDVAVAGAGLAGGLLAVLLGRAGARVALIDPGRFPREKLCGEYVSPEGVAALDRLGLGAAVGRLGGHPIRQVRLTTPNGRSLEARVGGPDGPDGLGLSRSSLDDLLVSEVRTAGAEVFEETRVGGAIVEEGRVVGLRARSARLGPIELRARICVAANGRHSALVRQTGTTRRRSLFRPPLFGLKHHVRIEAPGASEPEGAVGLHLVPGGYVGTCRVEGGLTNVCGILPEATASTYRGDLERLAHDQFARNPALARLWGASTRAGEWKTVAGVRVEVSTPRLPGIAFAGDCQGTVDPLGGQGMTMALLGAEGLAPRLLEALAEGTLSPARQRQIQGAWHRRFDGRVGLCRLFHHVLCHPGLIDVASTSKELAPRLLAACFRLTRDRSISTDLSA